jgi:DNA-directed RNA polymerase alpha subunit
VSLQGVLDFHLLIITRAADHAKNIEKIDPVRESTCEQESMKGDREEKEGKVKIQDLTLRGRLYPCLAPRRVLEADKLE